VAVIRGGEWGKGRVENGEGGRGGKGRMGRRMEEWEGKGG